MFTDGLTNKLVGGWKDGFKEDLVLVRSAHIVYSNWVLFWHFMIGPSWYESIIHAYKIQGVWRQDRAIHWSRCWGDVMTMQKLFSPQLHLSYILYSIGSVCVDDQSIKKVFCLLRTNRITCWWWKVENMKLLESGGNGAKLYATFQNGLAYEVAFKQEQHVLNIKHVYECAK